MTLTAATRRGRGALRSPTAVAATGSPPATAAAVDVLRRGGNAVDGAVCAAAVQSVVEFPWCGVGGDAFWLIRTPSGEVAALNGSGAAPAALRPGAGTPSSIPRFGPWSAAVPGFVDALCAAAERFGSLPLAELLAPAVAYASEGFALSPESSRAIARVRPALAGGSTLAALLDANGTRPGDVFRQPRLAATLEAVAREGRDAFYRGPVARALVAAVRSGGGPLDETDLEFHTSAWVAPIGAGYRDTTVYTQPPVSLGCVMLQQLRMYERLDLGALPFDDPVRIDAMVRCKHAAFGDALATLSDGPRAREHVDALLGDQHVARRCAQLYSMAPEDLREPAAPTGGDTTCLTVLDAGGSAVTLIHSLFNEFGSRVYEPATGVLLNDRLANQVVGSGPNRITGGRKPLHTLCAFLVERDGRPLLAGATPGGRGQVQINFQVIVNAVDCGMDLRAAVDSPRWLSGAPRRAEPDGRLHLEQGFAPGVGDELRRRGHDVHVAAPGETDIFGSVVAAGTDGDAGLLAVADHRREATAAGL